jgi:hypothetical protein
MKIRIIFKNLHDCIEVSQLNNDNFINSSAQSSHKVSIFNSNVNSNITVNTPSTRMNEVQVTSNDYVIDYISNTNIATTLPTLNTALQSVSPSPIASAVNSVRQSGQGQSQVMMNTNNPFNPNTSLNTSLRKEPDSRGASPMLSPYLTSNTIMPAVNNNKIADVKSSLAEQFNLKVDSLMLFTYTDKIRKVKDNEDISNFIFIKNGNAIFAVFYFKIEKTESPNDLIKVCVDFYQNNIDKIVYEIAPNCSVYMLKYMINKKLKNTFPIAEQSLVFSSIGNTSSLLNDSIMSKRRFSTGSNANNAPLYNNISNNSTLFTSHSHMKINNGSMLKDLKDDLSVKEILDKVTGNVNMNTTSLNSNNMNNSVIIGNIYQNTLLNLLLIRKGTKKCSIGLDFSFTFMRNMRKINFDQDAPSFREVSDGLNFFCYCMNKDCKLFNQMFVRNLGYDKFDMVKEMKNTHCPICNDRNNEIRSLGFINAEWTYRGMLINKHNSIISGDGITIDSKLYVMNETNLLGQMDKMEMVVKETQNKKDKKFQYDFDLNLDSAGDSDEDVDPLKDLDVQFSVKRKDLFPDVSSRTNYSKPASLFNFNTNNTNMSMVRGLGSNNISTGIITSSNNISTGGIITSSNNVNIHNKNSANINENKTNSNANNTSMNNMTNYKKEMNNVRSNNISANVTQLDEENIKENNYAGKNDDGFVIRMDNAKSNNCCFGGGRFMRTNKDAKGTGHGTGNNENSNNNDKSCLIY